MRWLCLLAIPVLVSGCALPAALTPLPDGGDLDLSLASGGDPWGGVDYAQLAQRVYKARTVERHYLTAGMMESEI